MATTLTKANIIDAVSKEIRVPHYQASGFVEIILETMREALKNQGRLKIASFGSFKVRQKSNRVGRNPKTGKEFVITSRKVILFKPSQHLRQKVEFRKS